MCTHLLKIDSQTNELDIDNVELLLKLMKETNKSARIDWTNRTIRILNDPKTTKKDLHYHPIYLELS